MSEDEAVKAALDEHEAATTDFNSLQSFLMNEITNIKFDLAKVNTLSEKRALNKRLKPLEALMKKSREVKGNK